MKLTVKIEDQVFQTEVEDVNVRPVRVWVDGEAFDVYPEEHLATASPMPQPQSAPLPPTPPAAQPEHASSALQHLVAAPIPGVIITVNVKAGDSVQFGQDLCVLEAMKMKNLIRANRAGTVAAVRVAVGDQVRQGQALLEYTD